MAHFLKFGAPVSGKDKAIQFKFGMYVDRGKYYSQRKINCLFVGRVQSQMTHF